MAEIYHELHYGDRVVRCFRPRATAVGHLLRAAVERNPQGEALVHGRRRINYAELDRQVNALASRLRDFGIGKGDRIAVLLGNRPEFVFAVLAAARIEAIVVPLNTRLQTPELAYVMDHCGARLLMHEAELADRLPPVAELPQLAHRFAIGGSVEGSSPLQTLLQPVDTTLAEPDPDEEDVAVILYTSGTTGRPKGAKLTHLGIVHSVMHYADWLQLTDRDRSIMPVPASHVTGLIANIMAMIHVAGCTVMVPEFKASDFLHLAQDEKITHTVMVPAMYNLCLMQAAAADFDLSAWRIGAYGGAPMPEATIARLARWLPRLQLINAYGATETTSPTTIMPAGETAAHGDSVGRVVACGEVLIMDADGREAGVGEPGEVWIKGPMVVPGYWRNPAATEEAFGSGFWRSGDIGSLDEAGYLRVFDRLKDMINRGGYKVYSVEVENALAHHPSVLESAVVARNDSVLGEKTQAFVRLRRADVGAAELKNFCADRIADYKIPDFITFLEQPLPRNAAGKLLKRELRELAQTQAETDRSPGR